MGHANTTKTGTSKLANEDVKTVNFKLPRARHRKLADHAELNGISTTAFVKKLIDDYIDKQIIPFEGS